jgi:hypothetical protein
MKTTAMKKTFKHITIATLLIVSHVFAAFTAGAAGYFLGIDESGGRKWHESTVPRLIEWSTNPS